MPDRTAKATKIVKMAIKAINKESRGQGKFESPVKRFNAQDAGSLNT